MILIEGWEGGGYLEGDEMVGNKGGMVRGKGLCGLLLLSVGVKSELYRRKAA